MSDGSAGVANPSPALELELRLEPGLSRVSAIRRLVEESASRVLDDPDAVSRLGLAAHELAENALKYGAGGCGVLHVDVYQRPEGSAASLTLTNESTLEN